MTGNAMPEDIIREAIRVLAEHGKYPYLSEEEIEAIVNDANEAIENLVKEAICG